MDKQEYPDDVLQAAREVQAQLCDDEGLHNIARAIRANMVCVPSHWGDDIKATARGIMAERERCARIAEGWPVQSGDIEYQTEGSRFWDAGTVYDQGRVDAAADIRLPQKHPPKETD